MRTIGIDPDLTASGVAVVVDGKLVELHALPFFDLRLFIDAEHATGSRFVLEDVEHNKPLFDKNVTSSGSVQKKKQRITQNVGQVKGVARVIAEHLARTGTDHIKVKPLAGTAKQAKKDAAFFNRLTGWTGTSNEDKRDAAMLALYGAAGGVYAQAK